MKKYVALLLALVLCLCSVSALAAGKLNTLQENFHTIKSYSTYSYAYAKVENSGDKPIAVNAGLLEVFDADGESIASTDYLNAYARFLQPGEYTYVKMYDNIEEENAVPEDYTFSLAGKSDKDSTSVRFPCEANLELDVPGRWGNTTTYMYATVTNNTEEPVYSLSVVLALLDAEGNILYIDEDDLYSDRALTPGSSMLFRKEIGSDFMDYIKASGFVPVSVDALAYVNNEVY